jgi:hypothetical protein
VDKFGLGASVPASPTITEIVQRTINDQDAEAVVLLTKKMMPAVFSVLEVAP